MVQRVEAWGNVLEFPDGMSDADMADAIRKNEVNLNPNASTFTKAKSSVSNAVDAGLSMLTPKKSIADRAAESSASLAGTAAPQVSGVPIRRDYYAKAVADTPKGSSQPDTGIVSRVRNIAANDAQAQLGKRTVGNALTSTVPDESIGLLGTLKEGAKGTIRSIGATADTIQGNAGDVIAASRNAAGAEKDPALEAFLNDINARKKAIGENPGWLDAVKAVGGAALNNPKGAGLLVAEQFPNSAVALGSGFAGMKLGAGVGSLAGPAGAGAGAVLGGLAGLFGANTALETGGKAIEAAGDGTFSSAEQSRVLNEGATKGAVITGVDAATLGLTNFIMGTTARAVERATAKTLMDNGVDVTNKGAVLAASKNPAIVAAVQSSQQLAKAASDTLGKKLSRGSGALGLESLGEGAGEYLGEMAATGKADKVEAAVEAISSLGQSMGEVAFTAARNKARLATIAGKPVEELSDSVLKYTANRGSERAKAAAQEELARRATQGVDPAVANAPESTSEAVDRIIATGKDKADEIRSSVAPDAIQSNVLDEPAQQDMTRQAGQMAEPDAPTPEPVATLNAQLNALAAGNKPGMLLTPGEPMPHTLPPGVKAAEIPGRGTLLYRDDATLNAAMNGQMGTALGYGIDEKPATASHAVTARDQNGTVIQDVATDGSKSVIQAAKDVAGPGGAVETRPIEQAMGERGQNNAHVVLPDNTHLPAKWDVVDADSVSASLKQGVNQPRDRSRAASDIQVQGIANNPDYRRLSDSPVMDVGAPTLSHDGTIVGGNGRFEGISRAYDQKTANDYLARLKADAAAKGIDPAMIDGMKKPVLVRRITEPFDTRKLAAASNSGTGMQYSGLELAKIDAERMKGLADLEVTDSGDIALTGPNIQNVRHALSDYNAAELGALTDKDGRLSQEGVRRIRNAMLYQAYGNSSTLARLVESTDNDLRNVSGALIKAAGVAARVHADIQSGALPAELDISADLVAAVETLSKIKAQGMTVDEYLAQIGIFGDETSDASKKILRVIESNIRSQKKIAEFIKSYYDSISRLDLSSGDMFGASVPTKPELLSNAKERITDKQPAVQDLFARSAGAPDAKGRQEPANNESASGSGKKDQRVENPPASPKAEAAPQPSPRSPEFPGIRPLVESLIKRRAAAKQGGKDLSNVIDRAKEVMDGKRTDSTVEHRWFRLQAKAFEKADAESAEILREIADAVKANGSEQKPISESSAVKSPEKVASIADSVEQAKPEIQLESIESKQKKQAIGQESRIQDFGEKIGGARKDMAQPLGKRGSKLSTDERPAWMRKYHAMQVMETVGYLNKPNVGRWQIMEESGVMKGAVRPAFSKTFLTEKEAVDALPLMVVSKRHRAYSYNKDGQTLWAVYRNITDRKRALIEGGFATYEDAMKAIAANPVKYIEHKFPFPERPWLDKIVRVGETRRTGDVTTKMFQDTFGFRGGEFGNWNMGGDGQEALNHAYDAMLDFAELLGVPPKALSLNGELAIAFGARGHGGVNSAAAHYEPGRIVFNLTKIKGAGSLAHEWWHAVDHYFARNGGKQDSHSVVADGHKRDSSARSELIDAIKRVVDTMTITDRTNVTAVDQVKKSAAKRIESLQSTFDFQARDWRNALTDARYRTSKKVATEEQLKQWDALMAKLREGDLGEQVHIEASAQQKLRNRLALGYTTGSNLRDANDIYKAVTGRAFLKNDHESSGRRMYWNIKAIADSKAAMETKEDVSNTRKASTDFVLEARKIDNYRTGDYWSTPEELGARAFESFIFDKLISEQKRSDYLVHAVENRYYAALEMKPYPEGAERQAINSAFGNLFSTLQTKETDKGIAFFSRPPNSSEISSNKQATRPGGLSVSTVEKLIAPLQKAGFKKINIAATESDLPQTAKEQIKSQNAGGVRGAYIPETDEIWLVADQLNDGFEVAIVAAHEARHRGLRKQFGQDVDPILRQIYITNKSVRTKANRVMRSIKGMTKEEATEEVLADLSIDGVKNLNGWKKLVRFIKQWLAEKFDIAFTDEMVAQLVAGAEAEGFKDGEVSVFDDGQAAAYGEASGGAVFSRKPAGSFESPEPSRLDTIIHSLQDKHIDLKRVSEAIKATGKQIADNVNPYLQEELFHERSASRIEDFLDSELDPLIKLMRVNGVKMADFEEYLWARHAEERNNQIAKINPDMSDGGSGMDTKDARDYLAKLDSDKKKVYESLAKRVDAINARSRQVLVDYGLESQKTIGTWESAYKHYVPLMREDMDHAFGNGTGQGFSVKGNSAKRATGSRRPVVDILANIAQQREKYIIRGEKNRVATALIGLAKENPNPDFWKVDTPPTMRTVEPGKTVYKVLYHGSVVDEFASRPAAQKLIDFEGKHGYTIEEEKKPETVVDRVDPNYKNSDNVIVARIPDSKGNIQERSVVFEKHNLRALRMAMSLKNLDQDQLGAVLNASSIITRYFASINTQYNPIFGIVNLIRDIQGAMLNLTSTPLAGKKKLVLSRTAPALLAIYQSVRGIRQGRVANNQWSQLWEEFQKEGGKTGFRDMYKNAQDRAEALEKGLNPDWWQTTRIGKLITAGGLLNAHEKVLADKAVKPLFEWLSDYNDAMENAVRLAAYMTALEQGMSKQQAASLAKNLTVNFNRKGATDRQIGALYAFFNASVQGTARLAETMKGPVGKKIITGGILLGGMQAMLLAMSGMGDDEPPEFVKSRSLILPIGDGKYLSVPMPLGFNVLPNIGRITAEFIMSGFKDPGKRTVQLMDSVLDAFNPVGNAGMSLQTVSPTAFDPLAALAENKDWTGKPIARQDFNSMNPTPGFTRAKDTASVFSKLLSEGINTLSGGTKYQPGALSPTPDQIDYLIEQATGGVGREYLKLEQFVSTRFTGEELPPHKRILIGRFYGDTKGQSSQGNEFYSNIKRLNSHEAEIKGRMKNREDLAGYKRDNPEWTLIGAANGAEKRVQELRKRKRELVEQGAPKERIKMLDEMVTRTMKSLNDKVRERTSATVP